MPTPIENNTASLETVMGKINGVSSEVNTQATQIEEIMTLLEGKTYDSASLQPKVVTPTAVTQTVTPDSGYEGLSVVTVNGDSDLVAENIKSGVNIFGVDGTYEGSGSGSVETCMVAVTTLYGSPDVIYTAYTENGYEVIHEQIPEGTTTNINNVVCNTAIVITEYSTLGSQRITANGSAELVENLYPTPHLYITTLKCTSTAVGTISVVLSGVGGQ